MVERLVALQVDDKDSYQRYRAGMTPLLEARGGGFGYDFEIDTVLKSETDHPINRVFTIRFPDEKTMDEFFAAEDYLAVRNEHFEPAVSGVTTLAVYDRD